MAISDRRGCTNILLVEDNPLFADALKNALKGEAVRIEWVLNGKDALAALKGQTHFAVMVIDQHLPDLHGDQLALVVRKQFPEQQIIFATGDLSGDTLTNLLKTGLAVGFIPKGTGGREVIKSPVMKAIGDYLREKRVLVEDPEESRSHTEEQLRKLKIIGRSQAMKTILKQIEHYRKLPLPTLISGESGAGKEVIPNAMVESRGEKIIAINCASFAHREGMMEAELFGVVKGAFTGADQDRCGIFESANGRTIFLDEMHCLSVSAQSKLLRVLDAKTVIRLGDGSARQRPCEFKVIAACKPEIGEMLRLGTFKKDLYYRIASYQIQVPSLRDRIEDIEPLVLHFERELHRTEKIFKRFRASTIRLMEQHSWLGEVRELQSLVGRLFGQSPGDIIEPRDFLHALATELQIMAPPTYYDVSHEVYLKTIEAEYFVKLLSKCSTQREAAGLAKISPSTLCGRLKALGISAEAHLKRGLIESKINNNLNKEDSNGDS